MLAGGNAECDTVNGKSNMWFSKQFCAKFSKLVERIYFQSFIVLISNFCSSI
jgi:hypothetical protein